jgi:small subunit ribosomal protein S7
MPRRAAATRREIHPDAVYNNRLVTQLINKILWDGKKSTAERIVYNAFDIIEQKGGGDPLATFKKAMDNVRPTLEVRPKRVGGATYQVPVEVNSRRRRRSPSAGSSATRAAVARRPWPSGLPPRSWMPPTGPDPR